MLQKTITMTSKGTFTLPAKIRKELGLNKAGDKLLLQFHQKSGQIVIEKPDDLRSLQAEVAKYLKDKGIKPIKDLDELNEWRAQAHLERWKRLNQDG